MKGVIFTAFIEYVETRFGSLVTENMISSCDLATDGAYTSVGTYKHSEIVQMICKLSEISGVSVPLLLQDFGKRLFTLLVSTYPETVECTDDSFSLITSIESRIHVEVRKLYPDADLPTFSHEFLGVDKLKLVYTSERGLADLADGLLLGCFEHFKEEVVITREDLSGGTGKKVVFMISRMAN